jgi:hypothetical protein
MYIEKVIGFDGREMWIPKTENGTKEYQENHLRLDVEKVLTVTQERWPSIFISSHSHFDGKLIGVASGYELSIPNGHESLGIGGLWSNLNKMIAFVESNSKHYQRKCWLIAITIVETPFYLDSSQDTKGRALYLIQKPQPIMVSPDEPDTSWIRLGYDVQDAFYTEGLGDTNYDLETRAEWGQKMNKYHLFDSQEFANLYSQWQENKENHPYFVYGIYLVKEFPINTVLNT